MIHIELDLTDIDYERVINEYLPVAQAKLEEKGSALGPMLAGGAGLFRLAPDSMKDRLVAELLNANNEKIPEELEKAAEKRGIPGRVRNLRASVK